MAFLYFCTLNFTSDYRIRPESPVVAGQTTKADVIVDGRQTVVEQHAAVNIVERKQCDTYCLLHHLLLRLVV